MKSSTYLGLAGHIPRKTSREFAYGIRHFDSVRPLYGYTHLYASISEEDGGGYTVQFRLCNNVSHENGAWGEEIAPCFETASMLIAALADEFSIGPEGIEIEIWMSKSTDGTRH